MFDSKACVYYGTHLAQDGQIDSALDWYNHAIEVDGLYSPAWWRRSMLMLLKGDYHAWPQYAWHTNSQMSHPNMGWYKRHFHGPLWDGKPLDGKRIFIHNDQGIGDCIQFMRYAKKLKEMGGKVILECGNDMRELALTCDGVVETVERDTTPEYDCHCSVMFLPTYFGISDHVYPYSDGYLKIPSKQTEVAEVIGMYGDAYKVGVCWRGNAKHAEDKARSTTPEMFESLRMDGVELFSLQKNELGTSLRNTGILLRDWTDTASAIGALDVVVTVDTSVAHLAGALGKPVWLLLAQFPDWRWGLFGSTSKWYNSMRVFRQYQMFEWGKVFEDVRDCIARR